LDNVLCFPAKAAQDTNNIPKEKYIFFCVLCQSAVPVCTPLENHFKAILTALKSY